MLKYVAAAGAFFATAHVVSNSLDKAGTFKQQPAAVDLDTLVDQAVEVLNRDRGTATAGAVFTGATRTGNTVLIELTTANAPKRYDANAASENLLKQVKGRWCARKLEAFMRQGGAVIYRYQTKGGLVLFDSKVDASVCKLSA